MSLSRGGSTSSDMGGSSSLRGSSVHEEVMSGWLQKWTNYIKGYRQRWFLLDTKHTLSYYRSASEVGHTCRGSINLQEARIHTDESNNLIISGSSGQTFHLKAQNELDRKKWLTALEYARHRAIRTAESDEDEDLKMDGLTGDGASAAMKKALQAKLEDLRTVERLVGKHGHELIKSLGDLDASKGLIERITVFRITTSAMMKAAEELVAVGEKETRRWTRFVEHEHEQRLRLQEQLETLARQHSSLERAAIRTDGSQITSPYTDSDEELFHDATDTVSGKEQKSDRKSVSSQQDSLGDRDSEQDSRGKSTGSLFNAEIVTPTGHGSSDQLNFPPAINTNARERRKRIPDRPQLSLNLWSIMRNCIGKELSKIPMPVNFNEPLSMLQRITEDLEYAYLLERGAEKTDSAERMCYVAAFAISAYSTTALRTTKPFNPLLGETFECDRSEDLGWRSVAEQVSHHPPAAAHHASGRNWVMYQDFTMTSKFRGNELSVIPIGMAHVQFPMHGDDYTFRKVTTTVHNIIVGRLWIDNHGEMSIENHSDGHKCRLKFAPYSYFSRDLPRKVTGVVQDRDGVVRWLIQGTWDKQIDILKVTKGSEDKAEKSVFETLPPRSIWKANPPYANSEKMYHFTQFAVELNEPEEGVAPTDSRLRPDQILMEQGKWDDANRVKLELEEKQRATRRRREGDAEKALAEGRSGEEYEPVWFVKAKDEYTGAVIHKFNGEYWKAKAHGDWTKCPQIF